MKRIKKITVTVSEATPIQLNWLVAECEKRPFNDRTKREGHWFYQSEGGTVWYLSKDFAFEVDAEYYNPATDWSEGGPIIEREGITVQAARWVGPTHEVLEWMSRKLGRYDSDYFKGCWHGDTPLIAAMRCYVASKLGDEVDVPEELK